MCLQYVPVGQLLFRGDIDCLSKDSRSNLGIDSLHQAKRGTVLSAPKTVEENESDYISLRATIAIPVILIITIPVSSL